MNQQTQQPMSFVVLRNTHEVFRSSIFLMADFLEKGALEDHHSGKYICRNMDGNGRAISGRW